VRKTLTEAVVLFAVGTFVGLVVGAVQTDGRFLMAGSPPSAGEGGQACEGADLAPEWIDQGSARALLEHPDVIFVDARPVKEHRFGRIPGAFSLPFEPGLSVPDAMLAELEGCKTVVAYCDKDGCIDSESLAEVLLALGVRQVRVLEGGWPDWYGAGYPVEGQGVTQR